jgi:hypothetical protein
MLGISRVAAQLAASQEGLSSMNECIYVLRVILRRKCFINSTTLSDYGRTIMVVRTMRKKEKKKMNSRRKERGQEDGVRIRRKGITGNE